MPFFPWKSDHSHIDADTNTDIYNINFDVNAEWGRSGVTEEYPGRYFEVL